MNANEMEEYRASVDNYIQESKLTDFFEHLTRLLVLSRPSDPVAFLVEVLENRALQRLILINSVVATKRHEVVQSLANSFNYKVISVEEVLADKIKASRLSDSGWLSDEEISTSVYDALKKTEKHHRGVIVSGFPSNLQQALFLQQKGIVPERFFYLQNNEEFIKQYYEILYTHSLDQHNIKVSKSELFEYVNAAVIRDRINYKELQQVYGNFLDEFDFSKRPKEDVIENIKQILKLRDRKNPPIRFPRVIIIRPPHLKERGRYLLEVFSRRYGLVPFQMYDIIDEQVRLKTEVGKYIDKSLREKIPIPNDIINSLIYTKVLSTQARNKGWIIEGYPRNLVQMKALKSHGFHPNLILILTEDDDVLIHKMKQLKLDLNTGLTHESMEQGFSGKLVPYGVDPKNDVKEFLDFTRQMEETFGDKVQQFKIDKDTLENVIRITDVFLNNPKIYN